ncbi:MAG: flavin reductase [Flavobacteriaceae bacterium]|jgi:flavin reductase (DIM6/NTAB) family NADH-FMN oxidoreductase RutF
MFVKKEMHSFSSADIQDMDKIFRLNLINSCTGYKSANLLGTRSNRGNTNLAVFSSITHLGSNPAIIGFVLRPTTVPRDTYKNIKETGLFTVNHIHSDVVADAHHTSAKYPEEISEFDQTDFKPEYIDEFYAPYVNGAKVRLGCQYLNEYEIKENDTLLIVSKIEAIHISENILQEDGWLSLEDAQSVTINGLDGYASPKLIERFDYARPKT